ncbi:hypothetical protein [Pedobacter metabolipauper]|uniref:Uncharacterized protein n=1 Tax=Pedobacter metabolipauper TaxID=425513 RepID=A0A4R6T2P4_9SPHI|nr:hypothetical protein [Pedobacter metabolipauper]TDQ11631.1 hypothetical protein ATK78_0754 [Pedobacter metabolipauper]
MENTQEKDLNPYEFTLEIDGEPNAIRVELPKPGDYIIYINGERTGHIFPETGNTTLQWRSKDDIDQKLVDELGARIEAIELGSL